MASRKEEKERLRKERLKAQQQSQAAQKRRLYAGYAVAGVLGVLVLAGIVVLIASSGGGDEASIETTGDGQVRVENNDNANTDFGVLDEGIRIDEREGTPPPPVENGDLIGAARIAKCTPMLDLAEEGNTHFSDLDKKVEYDTNPPTSGDHYAANQPGSGASADGAFLDTPNWNRALHALEHGRIEIQYSPDLPEEDQLALKGVFDDQPAGIQLFPNADMPYDVAMTAWTQLVGCKTFEGASTLDVIRDFRDSYLGRGPEAVPYQ